MDIISRLDHPISTIDNQFPIVDEKSDDPLMQEHRNVVIKKCHNVTQKCHVMTSCGCETDKKMQGKSAG